ncbi:MAG: hypothetical protein C5S44_02195 [Candidatus Methanocomedens sp.]|nr:MAG: hypothetical protein C5S44_02195 [ANME-2 cluster archaeon]
MLKPHPFKHKKHQIIFQAEPPTCNYSPKNPSKFAPKAHLKNRKALASLNTTRVGGADRDEHPGRVKVIGGGRHYSKNLSWHSFVDIDNDEECGHGAGYCY